MKPMNLVIKDGKQTFTVNLNNVLYIETYEGGTLATIFFPGGNKLNVTLAAYQRALHDLHARLAN